MRNALIVAVLSHSFLLNINLRWQSNGQRGVYLLEEIMSRYSFDQAGGGPARTFSAILFYILADYRGLDFGEPADSQEVAGEWAEAITRDIRGRGWSLAKAAEVFEIPIAVGSWEQFTVMISMAMLYAIHISDSEFGADDMEQDGDDD